MASGSAHRAFYRGRHFQEEGNYEAAIREFRRVTCCPDHRRTALYFLAECYLKSGQSMAGPALPRPGRD